jgi:hypothetical protein
MHGINMDKVERSGNTGQQTGRRRYMTYVTWTNIMNTFQINVLIQFLISFTFFVVHVFIIRKTSCNVMSQGDAREGKWKGNWRMEWVASTLHTTSEHGGSSNTTANAHIPAASSRLNWCPRLFKWTRPFRRRTKSGFYACAITFKLTSTCSFVWYVCHDEIKIEGYGNIWDQNVKNL